MDEHKLKKLTKQAKALQHKICCLIEEGFNYADLPEYANNTDAIAGGLSHGKLYRLPEEDDRILIAVVINP